MLIISHSLPTCMHACAACLQGMIGIAMNGIAIYSDADALNRDAYVYEGATMDSCRSHSSE
jgi:hypothetical protein